MPIPSIFADGGGPAVEAVRSMYPWWVIWWPLIVVGVAFASTMIAALVTNLYHDDLDASNLDLAEVGWARTAITGLGRDAKVAALLLPGCFAVFAHGALTVWPQAPTALATLGAGLLGWNLASEDPRPVARPVLWRRVATTAWPLALAVLGIVTNVHPLLLAALFFAPVALVPLGLRIVAQRLGAARTRVVCVTDPVPYVGSLFGFVIVETSGFRTRCDDLDINAARRGAVDGARLATLRALPLGVTGYVALRLVGGSGLDPFVASGVALVVALIAAWMAYGTWVRREFALWGRTDLLRDRLMAGMAPDPMPLHTPTGRLAQDRQSRRWRVADRSRWLRIALATVSVVSLTAGLYALDTEDLMVAFLPYSDAAVDAFASDARQALLPADRALLVAASLEVACDDADPGREIWVAGDVLDPRVDHVFLGVCP